MESMEAKFPKIISLILALLFFSQLYAQNSLTSPRLRIKLWSLVDQYPELEAETNIYDKYYSQAIREVKEIAPYVFKGMVFGFTFVYTPYDKTRHVDEYFELNINKNKYLENYDFEKNISFKNGFIKDKKLFCWAEFSLSHGLAEIVESRQSVVVPKVSGKGEGNVSDGEKGIEKAISDAVKNAVRNYGRSVTLNKPREMSGTIIIKDEPSISIQHGKYIVTLDFFIDCDSIIQYQYF